MSGQVSNTDQHGEDPWKHRSTMMGCHSCMWFAEKVVPPVVVTEVNIDDLENEIKPGGILRANRVEIAGTLFGRCRRHAPSMSGYPAVFGHDWCGDHKLDENSL